MNLTYFSYVAQLVILGPVGGHLLVVGPVVLDTMCLTS